jgi:hypothetical protein
MKADSLSQSMDLMGATMTYPRNSEIFGEGEPADYLYKVISGSVRTYKITRDGRRQVGGFYMPGDPKAPAVTREIAGVQNILVLGYTHTGIMESPAVQEAHPIGNGMINLTHSQESETTGAGPLPLSSKLEDQAPCSVGFSEGF